ncbi:hypothetical protein JAAARDRAFT_197160 [Jaapia argillacea MUCL 33604]|uniref:KOW domain-containing protein n=1 Tax=Jaapia argillacea MUCL 33604 TaxID=933084 RepID=A0A067PFL4_9AGAM|nr:hypothetical protein JAAARDRAFT_197160 [Jaapia argillacea MUCL 33604]
MDSYLEKWMYLRAQETWSLQSPQSSWLSSPSVFTRFVQVGRVVLINSGPHAGHIAVVAEIIDHNRVRLLPVFFQSYPFDNTNPIVQAIIDGPTTGVPRQSFPYRHLTLTPILMKNLPRGAGTGVIRKQLEKEATIEKWNKSSWAQKRAAVEARRKLNDFERFSVMLLKKSRRDRVRKFVKKAKA